MKAAKEHKPQQSKIIQNDSKHSVVQRGRGYKLFNHNPRTLVVKFNFAGSGYPSFPKAAGRPQLFKTIINRDNQDEIDYYASRLFNYNIVEFSYKGPSGWCGMRDTGNFSIENNLNRAKQDLHELLTNSTHRRLTILIKGHSRGGVAASRFANYVSELDTNIINTVELVLLDPVPGPLHSGEDMDITTLANRSTVIYSVKLGDFKKYFPFQPQIVRGAQRIILTDESHDCGTKKRFANGKKYRFYYNQRFYTYSELNTLKPGIYTARTYNITLNGFNYPIPVMLLSNEMGVIPNMPFLAPYPFRKTNIIKAINDRESY